MGRPALATLDDLISLLGSVENYEQAQFRLEQASELVRAYAGTDWLNDDESDVDGVPGAIPGVVVAIVDRATANPGGVVQETAGPFSRSFGADAAERMYLTAGEKLIVRHAVGRSGLSVVSTSRGVVETPSGSCDPASLRTASDL